MRAPFAVVCAVALFARVADERLAFAEPSAGGETSLPRLPTTERLLRRVQDLLLRQQYLAAERAMLESLKESPPATPPTAADCSRLALLGEVYLRSSSLDSARNWLGRALDGYDRAADRSRKILAEQAATAILLAKTLSQQDRSVQAAKTLEAMQDRYRRAGVADSVAQLDLLAQLSAIGPSAGSNPDGSRIAPADRLAERLAADQRSGLVDVEDYARGLGSLFECQSHAGAWSDATKTVEKLIRLRADRREIVEELSVRKRLAHLRRQQGDADGELMAIEQAAVALERDAATNRGEAGALETRRSFERGELERLAAAALLRAGRREESIQRLLRARDHYQSAWSLERRSPGGTAIGASEGRSLERQAEVSGQLLELKSQDERQLQLAIDAHASLLAHYRLTLIKDDPRIARLAVVVGGLDVKKGDGGNAAPLLREALDYWRRRTPIDYFQLAQTLHFLAESALLAGSNESAPAIERYLDEAQHICLSHFPTDPLRWRTQLAMARLYLATGRYRHALEALEDLASPRRQQPVPDDLRSAAFMQLGLLHAQLLRFDEAHRLCQQALELRERALGPKHPELLPFVLALGALDVARRDATALAELADRAKTLGAGSSINPGIRWEFAHQQAMIHYLRNEIRGDTEQRQAARDDWQRLLAEEPKLPLAMRARCLHYLARLDYFDWSSDVASWNSRFLGDQASFTERIRQLTEESRQYEQERQRYAHDFAAYEASMAGGAPRSERESQYRELLERRTTLEKKRLELRASHAETIEQEKRLAQSQGGAQRQWIETLAHGERLEEQSLQLLAEQGAHPSLQFAALCNAAQLLEAQAKCAPHDGDSLLSRAASRLEAAVALIEKPRANAFGDEFARAEFFAQYHAAFDLLVQFYIDAYGRSGDEEHLVRAIVAAERCRARVLLDQLRMAWLGEATATSQAAIPTVDELRDVARRWRSSQQLLLYYYVGASRSYLFVAGGSESRFQAIRLRIPSSAAGLMAAAPDDANASAIDQHAHRIHAVMSHPESAASVEVNYSLRQRIAESSSVLLPADVCEYLRRENAAGAKRVCVVPHAAISQLPLETLIVGPGDGTYLADAAPPLAYAPSLMLLDRLSRAEQKAPPQHLNTEANNPVLSPPGRSAGSIPGGAGIITTSRSPMMTVLTLGNPAYGARPRGNDASAPQGNGASAPQANGASAPQANGASAPNGGPDIARSKVDGKREAQVALPLLPNSQKECDRIESLFGKSQVVKLTGRAATEGQLRGALRDRTFSFVHLAAHGILSHSDLNPWLALAPAAPGQSSDDDGRLELREIYGLNLAACELTALSACDTNLDPRQARRLREAPIAGADGAGADGAAALATGANTSLDTSFSVSNAFLVAGSRRVLAAQWTVADDSTACLIETFFDKLHAKIAAGQPIDYAAALAESRRALREDHPQWNSPFFWAPFVLVGPADSSMAAP